MVQPVRMHSPSGAGPVGGKKNLGIGFRRWAPLKVKLPAKLSALHAL